MNKTEFWRSQAQYINHHTHVFSVWAEWSEKNGVIHEDVMSRLTNGWDFNIHYTDQMMVVKHKDGEDRIPLSELWEDEEYPEIVMLWHVDYWDGPLSGMCLYQTTKYWFNCESMEHDDGIRTFGLYTLSDEEIAYEERWHGLFRKMVGHHCDYGEDYAPYKGNVDTNNFYEMKRKSRDYTKNEKIGVFDECLFKKS